MISSALAMLLLAAAPNGAAQSREAYARCLKDVVISSVEKKLEAVAFDAALASACRDKETLFKTQMISADMGMGIKRPSAEKAMSEEIADYRNMAKEDFKAALADSPKP
jgi:heme oxygenase